MNQQQITRNLIDHQLDQNEREALKEALLVNPDLDLRKIIQSVFLHHLSTAMICLGWSVNGTETNSYVSNLCKQLLKDLRKSQSNQDSRASKDIWAILSQEDLTRILHSMKTFGWRNVRGTSRFGILPSSTNLLIFEINFTICKKSIDIGNIVCTSSLISDLIQ